MKAIGPDIDVSNGLDFVCRYQVLLATSQLQHIAKLYEDAAGGKYKRQVEPQAADGVAVGQELTKAAEKHARLVEVIQMVQEQAPMLHEELDRILAHAAAASSWMQGGGAAGGVVAH